MTYALVYSNNLVLGHIKGQQFFPVKANSLQTFSACEILSEEYIIKGWINLDTVLNCSAANISIFTPYKFLDGKQCVASIYYNFSVADSNIACFGLSYCLINGILAYL